MILALDTGSDTPLYQQLRDQVVLGIASGKLQPGESLPTVRQLALELGVNTMTVNKGYAILKEQGYLQMDRRRGAQVAPRPGGPLDKGLRQRLALLIAEAGLSGMCEAAFLQECRELYANMPGLQGPAQTQEAQA